MRRAVDQMENEGQRTEQAVELREMLTDDGVILIRDLLPIEFGRPIDEDFLSLVAEPGAPPDDPQARPFGGAFFGDQPAG